MRKRVIPRGRRQAGGFLSPLPEHFAWILHLSVWFLHSNSDKPLLRKLQMLGINLGCRTFPLLLGKTYAEKGFVSLKLNLIGWPVTISADTHIHLKAAESRY